MTRALLAALAAAVLLVGAHLALGGGGYDVADAPDPCARSAPDERDGAVGAAERIGLNALNGAACQLGVTRERLLLTLSGEVAPPEGLGEDERADAFRTGLNRAIDEEERAGRLDATEAGILRGLVSVLPVDAVLDQLFGGD